MTVRPGEVRSALQTVARHGRFFDLTAAGSDEPIDWYPLHSSCAPLPALRDALTRLTRRLAAPEQRPVASLLQMSAVAQLTAPLLATATEFGLVPLLTARHLAYGFTSSGAFRAQLIEPPSGVRGSITFLAQAIRQQLDGPLNRVTASLTAMVSLSPATTSGNTASALAAAARQLEPNPGQDGTAARAFELVDILLARGPLRGSGTFTSSSPDRWGSFRRRNCCLFYRLPGGSTCGDCILSR